MAAPPLAPGHSEAPFRGVKVCFFNRVNDRRQLSYVSHFANDIRLLGELGCDVHVATRAHELRPADLYYVWWWTWAFQPLLLARLLRRPTIVTGAMHAHEFAARSPLQQRIIEFAFRHASANLFISEAEEAACVATLPVHNPHHVPLVVDTARYVPGQAARDPDTLFTVVWMTRGNGERKCVPELIEALAAIRQVRPAARLAIAGEKLDGYPVFAELARQHGVSDAVEFLGVIDEAEKIRRMQTCAAYVQPTHFEGFGAAILEAMSCGAPVVTTAVGAVPQVVGDTSELVRANTPAAIAESTLRVLGDAAHARSLSGRARSRAVEEFSLSRRRTALAAILAEVLGR